MTYTCYCVKYEYQDRSLSAVYFELQSAQEAMIKMMRKGVKCNELCEIQYKMY